MMLKKQHKYDNSIKNTSQFKDLQKTLIHKMFLNKTFWFDIIRHHQEVPNKVTNEILDN